MEGRRRHRGRIHPAGQLFQGGEGEAAELRRHGLRLRSARVQQFSPDPDYAAKVVDLELSYEKVKTVVTQSVFLARTILDEARQRF